MKKRKVASYLIILCILILAGEILFIAKGTRVLVEERIRIGEEYVSEGRYEEARLEFKKALEMEPHNMEASIKLAECDIVRVYNVKKQK
ncbi:tetratricopeptide repeat protein [Oceanirhabdus sp. W0125-5]|uniref:tetratricopeptide repeat protein n=1 Tax=Oceanirhabdus sp. W0125-5 TaxID=2999116 RepID=UPI0022F2E5AE|nr:tetratricopeptide repeat protein [Oceanirhabdus sp. W0125-5]WBW99122.1 tetratricopeptide repeat protein [Oceanirhabdus sp. W0125-5]